MSNPTQLPMIPAGEILRRSSRFPVTLQDETTPGLNGYFFSSDEDAVRFKAAEHPGMMGKVELPLELAMQGAFRLEDPSSSDRLAEEVVERYLALKEKAGNVLHRLFNTRIAATPRAS